MISAVDQELSAKIESELHMEKDIRDSEQYPGNVQDYLDNSPFEVVLYLQHPYRDTDFGSYKIHQVRKQSSSLVDSEMKRGHQALLHLIPVL